jgi:uncharacterized protein with beta-barrel porin domain
MNPTLVSPMPTNDEANARRVRTLSAEIDSAAAMMALAKLSSDDSLVRRYKEAALRSYLSALDLFATTTLTPKEEHELWDRIAPIRQWLEMHGALKH